MKENKILFKKAKLIAKQYGVTIHFSGKKHITGGHAHTCSNVICIFYRTYNNSYHVLSGVFHEIGHCIAFKEKRFFPYHNGSCDNKYIKRYALNAEIYVDKWAEKEFKKMFPNKKFYKGYRTKREAKWLDDYYKKDYTKERKCYHVLKKSRNGLSFAPKD